MNRKVFLKQLGLGVATAVVAPKLLTEEADVSEIPYQSSRFDTDDRFWPYGYITTSGNELLYTSTPIWDKELAERFKENDNVTIFRKNENRQNYPIRPRK